MAILLSDISIADVRLLVPRSEAEIDSLEDLVKSKMPKGYRKFMTTLGDGELAGGDIQIQSPRSIALTIRPWRRSFVKDNQDLERIFTMNWASQCIRVATSNTIAGDLVFHPDDPDRIVFVPRDDCDPVQTAGIGLFEALSWVFSVALYGASTVPRLSFEPYPDY